MDDQPWRPRSIRNAGPEAAARFDGPHEGVPPWLKASLVEWRDARFRHPGFLDMDLVNRLVRHLRMDLGPGDQTLALLEVQCIMHTEVFLDVVDALLADFSCTQDAALELEVMLIEAGSAYTIREDPDGILQLQHRLDPTVKEAAEQAAGGDRAGQHLSRAWSAAFGRAGNPGQAYWESVRAVEAAAGGVVSPKNKRCTLGTLIADLKNGGAKFEVRLDAGDKNLDQVAAVVGMLELLWKGQNRHGSEDESVPIDVSPEEAAAAVHLAVVLVQWFRSGVVRRRAP